MPNSARHPLSARVVSNFAEDPDFQDLLLVFMDSLEEQRGEIVAAFEAGDRVELARKAHQLKGAGGGYGFPGLSDAARRLEDACQGEARPAIASGFNDLLTSIDRILPM